MDILIEIQKEEMNVENLVRDWHVQKLESFIIDLIKRDREEQLHKLLQHLSDEDELINNRTHQQIIFDFNNLLIV